MVTHSPTRTAFAPAGLFVGPAAWAAHTQAAYALADACPRSSLTWIAVGLVFAAIAAAGGVASLRSASWRAEASDSSAGAVQAPRSFLGAVGAMTSFFFMLVIVAQASAALFLEGCAR